LWIDHIVQPILSIDGSKNYDDENIGLIKGKPLLVVSAAGWPTLDTENDYHTGYINAIFKVLGFTDIRHVAINNTS